MKISSDRPFSPKKFPFFYGWLIAVVGTLGVIMSTPGQTIGVSAFTEHLLKAFDISRNQFSLAYMIGTVTSSLFLIKAGKMYDKHGVRIVAGLAAFGMGLALIGLSFSDAAARRITFLPHTYIAVAILIIGFFALRFCGQGVLTMTSRNMVAKWFIRKRGLVVGVMGIFISLSFSEAPEFLDFLIRKIGWRMTWISCAIVAGFLFSIIIFIFYRDNPEECGLIPDGTPAPENEKSIHDVKKQFTLEEARRSFAFWVFSVSLAMFALYITALTFHIASVFKNNGLPVSEAFSIFFPASVISVFVRVAGGYISDKIKIKYLLSVFIIGMMISIFGLVFLKAGMPRWLIISGNGIASGLFALILSIAWPTYFGRKNLGAISGLNMTVIIFFSAVGPWIFSQSLSIFGSYKAAGILCIAVVIILLILSFRADNPQLKITNEK